MRFHVIFAALAKLDPPRRIPKIFLKSSVTTIPFVIDPNPKSCKQLPHNACRRSDFSREENVESMVLEHLKTLEERKMKLRTPSEAAKYYKDVEPVTWEDSGMGVADRL